MSDETQTQPEQSTTGDDVPVLVTIYCPHCGGRCDGFMGVATADRPCCWRYPDYHPSVIDDPSARRQP